ncbi:MAG: ATP-grasp domain-containing protein [Proteobacteria bacterium]|nr:ATP-grasp domain-containing protein [Pseudomonadota bacterium]
MRVNVATTGLTSSDVTAPGLGVLRSLRVPGGIEGRLIGLAYDPLDAGCFEPGLADEIYVLPFPSQGMTPFLKRLEYIHARSHIDVFIPNLDAELPLVIQQQDRLAEMGIRVFLPSPESFKARSKDRMVGFAQRLGLSTPRTLLVHDEAGISNAASDLGYPFWVKGLYYEAYLVSSFEEAMHRLRKITATWGYPVLFQEALKGQEFNICALGDGRGGLVGAVPITKLTITEKGKAWSGVTVNDETLLDLTRDVVRELSWRGPLEVEIIKTTDEGRYHILEINPRFPAWCYLCQAAGQNLPLAMVQLALGRNVPPFEVYQVGVGFVRSARDLIFAREEFEAIHSRGEITR